jgi:hypothetical protein
LGWIEDTDLNALMLVVFITTQPNSAIGNHKLNDSLDVNYILCCRKL